MSLSALKGPADVEAEVIMSRMLHPGAFLVVEGDDDSRFFRGRVDGDQCEVVIGGGKAAVEGGIRRLNARHFRGALGVVDDDCERCGASGAVTTPNLIAIPDARDLDALLVWSPALDRVLNEYGDQAMVAQCGGIDAVRTRLSLLGQPFGALRCVSLSESLGINFQVLRPVRFIKGDWAFNADDLYEAAANQIGITKAVLTSRVAALSHMDPKAVCQGHDLLDLLALGLCRKRGIVGRTGPSASVLASALRVALDAASWHETALVREIQDWEAANGPFKVLR